MKCLSHQATVDADVNGVEEKYDMYSKINKIVHYCMNDILMHGALTRLTSNFALS